MTPDRICCTFTSPSFDAKAGEVAVFRNETPTTHNVKARERGPDGLPLFRTRDLNSESGTIDGTQYLAPGTYRFRCTIHLGMRSKLQVAAGRPKDRPSVSLRIPRQAPAAAAMAGDLRVRTLAKVRGIGVALIARAGEKRLGRLVDTTLTGNQTQVIPLTPAGRRALSGTAQVQVTVRALVPFGRPAEASRTLR